MDKQLDYNVLFELSEKLHTSSQYRERHENRSNAWFFLGNVPLMVGA